MEYFDNVLEKLIDLIPTGVTATIVILVIVGARMLLNRAAMGGRQSRFRNQIIVMILWFAGLLIVVLTLPVSDATIGQLLSLLGLLMSAAIALSATTFVGNIMAGLMLRAIRNFRLGDFVQVGENFGRVTERGLFHVEIQTEDRNLTTLPNLYVVTNPVNVARASGTLVSAEVSLGYDVPRKKIKEALLEAAERVGLEEPFVHVMSLGDFSVTYKVAGKLREVKSLLSSRSSLNACAMDRLHAAGIEIVSPTFMNTRPLDKSQKFMAKPPRKHQEGDPEDLPESMLFDKADEAETIDKLRERLEGLKKESEDLKAEQSDADPVEREKIKERRERIKGRMERLSAYIAEREKEVE